ncbi:MAG: hypothetical protein ABIO92_00515 [Chloroflexia bacterium]
MQNALSLNRTITQSAQAELLECDGVKPSRPWLQDLWLWILLVGPLVAPLFAYLGYSVLQPFAEGIYLLGRTVCPKVGMHFMFLGQPMAVCSSCWAAVWGLWTVRLLYGRAGEGVGPFSRLGLDRVWAQWRQVDLRVKLAILVAGFFPWALDVMLWDTGIWRSPHLYMMFAGFTGGLVAGSLILPTSSEMRARLAYNKTS